MNIENLQREILKKIARLTEAGKVDWRESPKTGKAIARITPMLTAEFDLRAAAADTAAWDKLTVLEGAEIVLRVANAQNLLEHVFLKQDAESFYTLANDIFDMAVLKPRRERMQRALDELNALG